MFKRTLMLTVLLLVAVSTWAKEPILSNECKSIQTERAELQSALRKSHVLDKIEIYKQQIQNLSARFAETCFTNEQIADRKAALFNPDISLLENQLAKPLSQKAYLEKQAAWQRFYVMPTRCFNQPLELKYLDWCIDNKQFQFQKFDTLWQQKNTQIARSEAKLTDSFHEFVLPSKTERAKLSAQQQLKRYSNTTDSFLPTNIIVLCVLAVSVFFGLIFIFHWLMRPRPVVK
ncbi:hypothetical protein NH514_03805 [Pseudoalteromonas sp. ACER1]|uniref:hypothetical protein n=1 Tax=unclassified Pseudoalteromonas TaxID=194690 RepID=UPI001F38D11C|nr:MULTISPECIES: hypothetical protein [unclassified Pseudoalteromonas]MCF2846264.1 hypothetical protein [Pseudoalteromonas sp. PAST1]MCO7209861.1 hypothetical protein [Pseudoalteromonas sp. ACER1]|tara:strand:+ start:935 stop:1630 length:696 start_codon:yes stop_codon:yes gene_type:complete